MREGFRLKVGTQLRILGGIDREVIALNGKAGSTIILLDTYTGDQERIPYTRLRQEYVKGTVVVRDES